MDFLLSPFESCELDFVCTLEFIVDLLRIDNRAATLYINSLSDSREENSCLFNVFSHSMYIEFDNFLSRIATTISELRFI